MRRKTKQWRRRGAFLLVATLGVTACRDGTLAGVASEDAKLRAMLVAQGFRPEQIEDHGSYFLVERDIVITKASLGAPVPRAIEPPRRWVTTPPLLQYSTSNLVSQSVVTSIGVDVSGAESSWQTAIRAAMTEWNQVTPGAAVKFVEASPAQITFGMVDSLPFVSCTNGVVAAALFPSGGQPGNRIVVSNQVTNSGCLNASQKKFNMVHELGHTIGLRHSNWAALGESSGPFGANQVYGTPSTDNVSVMNGNTGSNSWVGFSTYDKLAAFTLYPPPQPTVNPASYPNGVPTLSWSALPDSPKFRILLSEYYYFWYDPAQDYESSSWSTPGDWTYATSGTYSGASYTGFSECSTGTGGPGTSYHSATWLLQIQYPIADETGYGTYYAGGEGAQVLTC